LAGWLTWHLQHWHGLTQRTAPFSDGTPLVSQWPISKGRYFDYEIRPELGDAGTYFYHSHVGFQAVTAQGLLIVQSANKAAEPYKYDDEFSLVFGDYYPQPDHVLEAGLDASPFVWSGEPQALLMNGQSGNSTFDSAPDDSCKPHVVTVKPGKTYRVRFVGGTGLYSVIAGIGGHSNLTIIEADGQWTKKAATDHVQLGTGQRFSALLQTKTKAELAADNRTSYWIQYDSHDRLKTLTAYGLLVYDMGEETPKPSELPAAPPVSLSHDQSEYVRWMEYTLEAHEILKDLEVDHETFPTKSEVTRVVYIQLNQKRLDKAFNQEKGGDDYRLVWE
jgi:L-ascorbate oxidase